MHACDLCARLNLSGAGARGRLICITIQTGVQDISGYSFSLTLVQSRSRIAYSKWSPNATFDERFFSLTAFRAHTDLFEDLGGADVYSILWFGKVSENANEWTFIC